MPAVGRLWPSGDDGDDGDGGDDGGNDGDDDGGAPAWTLSREKVGNYAISSK